MLLDHLVDERLKGHLGAFSMPFEAFKGLQRLRGRDPSLAVAGEGELIGLQALAVLGLRARRLAGLDVAQALERATPWPPRLKGAHEGYGSRPGRPSAWRLG